MSENGIRINKYLSDAGVLSRREADKAVEAREVLINGDLAAIGQKVMPSDEVLFKGKKVTLKKSHVIIAYNKPKGLVCSTTSSQGKSVVDDIDYQSRIYPIGRLDKDSTGLLLLTDNGEIVNKILKGSNYHEKEYEVKINKPVSDAFIERMSKGVYLEELDITTRPCRIKKTGENTFSIILTQGLNRQIRRMSEACGAKVVSLHRIRIMNIKIGSLKTGEYKELTGEELKELYKLTGYNEK